LREEKVDCDFCKDAKWVIDAATFRLAPCPRCADLFAMSKLPDTDRGKSFADIVELPGDEKRKQFSLKWAGQRLLDLKYGFATLYGNYGTAKTLFGQIVVAEACRRRLRARYILGKDLERKLFEEFDRNRNEERAKPALDDPFSIVSRFQVLVIDECQMINWKSDWVAAEIMRLIEMRHAGAVEQAKLTILIGQTHPLRWGPEQNVGALLSRTLDGRFALPWPKQEPTPPCLLERPCVSCTGTMRANEEGLVVCSQCGSSRDIEMYWPFGLDLADVRPILPPLAGAEEHDELAAVFATE
jgi:hypothetical protein